MPRNRRYSMMREKISKPLDLVQKRCRVQRIFEGISWGLIVGSVAVIPLLLAHVFGFADQIKPMFALFAFLFGGTLLGSLVGFLSPIDPHDSARQTDQHYRFKDRLLTAKKLLGRQNRQKSTLMERLQLDDAVRHAEKVDPKAVVPYRLPQHFSWAMGTTALAFVIGLVSPYFNGHQQAVAAAKIQEIVSAADLLQEELIEKLAELAEENPEEKGLKELSEKARELLAQLNESTTDRKESLATLSEMEQAIRSAMSEFQVEAVDASMKDLAEAMSAAEATRAASQAMKDGRYSKAAEELEKLDSDLSKSMSKQERRAVAEQMKQALDKMNQRGQKNLLNAAKKLSEGLEKNDGQECKDGACQLAGECKKQSLRKGICEGLEGKLALLGLCKSECNGGQCQGNQNGGDNTNKSDQASKNWGTGAAGNPTSGEETQLDSVREQQQVKGMIGAGESEYEKLTSDEATQEQTSREFRQNFQEYRKMSEAVLQSEPIPLGQRQMIRRYFESIRPTDPDAK